MEIFKCKIPKVILSAMLTLFLHLCFFIGKNQSTELERVSATDITSEEISVVVNNYNELASAITGNNNYNTIYLNADIEITARINYPTTKTNLTINGTYTNEQGITTRHTLTDMNSSSISNSIYISSANDNFKNRTETKVVIYAGVLEPKTVPNTLAFKSTVIPTVKTTIQRQNPDWSIVV